MKKVIIMALCCSALIVSWAQTNPSQKKQTKQTPVAQKNSIAAPLSIDLAPVSNQEEQPLSETTFKMQQAQKMHQKKYSAQARTAKEQKLTDASRAK